MKKISVVCFDNGKATVRTSDISINNENLATELEIDFSGTENASLNKWVDITVGSVSVRYDLGVEEIPTLDLTYAVSFAGEMIITPFVYDGTTKVKYKTDFGIIIKIQVEAGTADAIARDDYIFELKEQVDATLYYSATDFASVTRVTGKIYAVYNESTGIITWYYGAIGV